MFLEVSPDIAWVARLACVPLGRARRAVGEAARDHRLFGHLVRMHRTGGRPFYVEIEAPFELYALVRLIRPRHVVEVGVSSGVSSAYILQALARNRRGKLHSIDRPKPETPRADPSRPKVGSWAIPPGRSSGWAVPSRLKARWDLRIGDKSKLIEPLSNDLDEIDLFLYDVPHSDPASFQEFEFVDRRFRPGSIALVDHGGTEETCPSLSRWAKRRGARATLRSGLGLAAFRSER